MFKMTMTTFLAGTLATTSHAQDLWFSYIEGARTGQNIAVRSALESGRVNVDFAFDDGNTALMYASLAGHEGVVDTVLEAGADVNAANQKGETALILAAMYGFTGIAVKLIEARAGLNARDASGRTAWTWAHWGENQRLTSLLEASGAEAGGKSDPFDPGAPVERYEKTPQMTKYRAPKVPEDLKKKPVSGTLKLRLVVKRDGRPTEIVLVEGFHEELDKNTLDAATKWKFDPGEIQGKPVDGIVDVNVRFSPGGDPDGVVTISTRRWRS